MAVKELLTVTYDTVCCRLTPAGTWVTGARFQDSTRSGPEHLSAIDGVQVVDAAETDHAPAILIVEDEALIAANIEEVLAESGFRVAGVAASALEALSLADEHRPELALVDIRLTGSEDGIELACLLRERFGVPSIFLSGFIDAETAARAERARPLGFLHKPFRPSQVFNAIERALNETGR